MRQWGSFTEKLAKAVRQTKNIKASLSISGKCFFFFFFFSFFFISFLFLCLSADVCWLDGRVCALTPSLCVSPPLGWPRMTLLAHFGCTGALSQLQRKQNEIYGRDPPPTTCWLNLMIRRVSRLDWRLQVRHRRPWSPLPSPTLKLAISPSEIANSNIGTLWGIVQRVENSQYLDDGIVIQVESEADQVDAVTSGGFTSWPGVCEC